MENSKLKRLLDCCEPKERRAFRQAGTGADSGVPLQSLALWDLLIRPDGNWRVPIPDREHVHRALFPGQSFRAQRVLDAYSRLFRHLRDFLMRHWADQARAEEAWLGELLRRGEVALFEQEHRRLSRALTSRDLPQEAVFFQRYQLASLNNEAFGYMQVRRPDANLQAKLDWLDQYYLCVKLRESCELLNRSQIMQAAAPLPLLGALLDELAQPDHPYRQVPAVDVYYHVFAMLSHPQDASRYHHLLSVLARYAGHFAPGETRAMYKFAQNHCIRHINTGSQAWLEELFVLYQRLLKEEVLLEDGHLAHTDFKNIATAGLRMQAYDWVEDFIRQYREQVPPPYGESVYRYSLAACYFETGDLGQALRLLQEAEPADDHYQLSFRHLMAKIYFRQGAYETLFYQLDAFRRFLARNQGLGDTTRRSQEGFVHLLRRTARLAEQWPYLEGKKAHQRQARLSQKLSATEAVADRAWLESQIQDLGGYSSPP